MKLKPTFRQGDKVMSTKAAFNLFRNRGGIQYGTVSSDQRTRDKVNVWRDGISKPERYSVIFWKLVKK